MERINQVVREHQRVIGDFFDEYVYILKLISDKCTQSLQNGNKILVAGNGGSATDAMHFAGELVGRFEKERTPLPVIALNADVCTITAIANDYGFNQIFSKQIKALGKAGDIFLAISTSGKSSNIITALKQAKSQDLYSILLTSDIAEEVDEADLIVRVPSRSIARIQECHITFLHILSKLIEENFIDVE